MSLQALIDRELDEAGFGKEGFNPFTSKDHGRPGARADTPSETTVGLVDDIPSDSAAATKLQDAGSAKALFRNPIIAMKSAAAKMPVKQLLNKLAQNRAGKAMGMASGNEVHQAFTSSEAINRIKLAGLATTIANWLPEELMLPLVQKFKGTAIFPQAAEVESFLLGKGLRAAAESRDVAKARRLYEAAGGVPSIDPLDLWNLKLKAEAMDSLRAGPWTRAAMGAGAGTLGGLGLGVYLARSQGQPAQAPSPQLQMMKVVPQ